MHFEESFEWAHRFVALRKTTKTKHLKLVINLYHFYGLPDNEAYYEHVEQPNARQFPRLALQHAELGDIGARN
jgi:hypothetical protein